MRRSAGFSYIELIVVITLVIILVATAIENLLPLTGEAERVAVERNRVAVDTALRGAAAERLVKQGREAVIELETMNPVELLGRQPSNYLGEQAGVDPADIPPGHWVWDPLSRSLIYRLRHARYFQSEGPGPAHIRFDLRREGDRDFFALHLKPRHDYAWDREGSEMARWLLAGRDEG